MYTPDPRDDLMYDPKSITNLRKQNPGIIASIYNTAKKYVIGAPSDTSINSNKNDDNPVNPTSSNNNNNSLNANPSYVVEDDGTGINNMFSPNADNVNNSRYDPSVLPTFFPASNNNNPIATQFKVYYYNWRTNDPKISNPLAITTTKPEEAKVILYRLTTSPPKTMPGYYDEVPHIFYDPDNKYPNATLPYGPHEYIKHLNGFESTFLHLLEQNLKATNAYESLIIIKKYLKQEKITSIASFIRHEIGFAPRVVNLDWSKIYVKNDHLATFNSTLQKLAVGMNSTVKVKDAVVQVIIVTNNDLDAIKSVKDCKLNLILACCGTWENTERVRKTVEVARKPYSNRIVRFDYVNPDDSHLIMLAKNNNNYSISQLKDTLMEKIKEGIIALQYASYEGNGDTIVTEEQFNQAAKDLNFDILNNNNNPSNSNPVDDNPDINFNTNNDDNNNNNNNNNNNIDEDGD